VNDSTLSPPKDVVLVIMDNNGLKTNSIENLLLLCIDQKDLEDLQNALDLNMDHHRYIKLTDETYNSTGNFYRYKLEVQGLDDTLNQNAVKPASSLIYVYTKDGLIFTSQKFAAEIPYNTHYTRNFEEDIGIQIKSGTLNYEDHFIGLDPATEIIVNNFITDIEAIPNDSSARAEIMTLVDTGARAIFQQAVTFQNTTLEDRPLYWARIKMEVALKSHSFLLQSVFDKNELLKKFEEFSRNYTEVDFSLTAGHPALKKITISGSAGSINDADYTVKSVNLIGADTVIEVFENIADDSVPYGDISYDKALEIIVVDQVAKVFTVAGDHINELSGVSSVDIFNSNGNDGTYTISGISLAGSDTEISVTNPIPDPETDGGIFFNKSLPLDAVNKADNKITILNKDLTKELSYKKILITGFDPFQLHPDYKTLWSVAGPETYNPSGMAVLALHDQTLINGPLSAYIQVAIFPVRYIDFDNRVVENLVEPFLQNNSVDMIMTLSLNGSAYYFDLERYAGKKRGGGADNEYIGNHAPYGFTMPINLKPFKQIQKIEGGNEFYETTLPVSKIVTKAKAESFIIADQRIFYDQSYIATGSQENHPISGPPNTNYNAGIPIVGDAEEGSGADYLSNEIFYRVARSRENKSSNVKTGHYHVANDNPSNIPIPPPPHNIKAYNLNQIVDEVKGAVERALVAL
jgi:pyrrolidone-carboxylate peptidase